jgi:competence protein ComEC
VRVFAKLSRTVPARNPGEFDFARHARANRQLSVLRSESPDCVTVLSAGTPWRVRRMVDRLRRWGRGLLWGQLGSRQSALAAAVLLGAREQVGAERTQSFITTGTVHLLVVSGLHMGILAGGLFFALRLGLLPRRTALVLVAVLVVAYTILTEARPPVVRACVLVVVVCLARLGGRRALAFNSLAAAALAVLALNPADLFRTGPQLSFLAVASLAWLGTREGSARMPDALDQLLTEARPWPVRAARRSGWAFWQLTLASTVVWFVVEPLVMARFHLLTPIAVLISPILWLPVAASLMSGFGVLLFGWLVPPLGLVFAWICDRSLALVERCVTTASALPGSHFWVPGPADWWLVGFYGGLALLTAFPRFRPPRRWCLALFAGWVALGLAAARSDWARRDALQCTVLSMGHGCAVVMELPTGQTILYDCGSLGPPHSGARTIAWYLWSRGITRLDAVVLSHADVDHYNALPELLQRFHVRAAVVSPRMFAGDAPGLTALRSALETAAVPVRTVWAGGRLAIGHGMTMAVLHPPRAGVPGSDNANSIVMAVDYAGRRFLLPGDLEPPGLEKVTAQPPLDCSVLLAPHHGSHRSDPAGFAAWCAPEWVVISGGWQGDLRHVTRPYGNPGMEVLHTAARGAIQFTVSDHAIRVSTFLTQDR